MKEHSDYRKTSYLRTKEKENFLKYEHFCVQYHEKKYGHQTWHWCNIPEEHLEKSGWITDYNKLRLKRKEKKKEGLINSLREYGLDGISLDKEGNYHALQMKYWKVNKLTANDLGTFLLSLYAGFYPKNNLSKGYLYHSNQLQIDLKDYLKTSIIVSEEIDLKRKSSRQEQEIDETQYKKRDYQIKAIEKLKEGWNENGLITLPCGTGKTNILGWYLQENIYKKVILLSPLKVQTKQLGDRIKKYIPDFNYLLVDSDESGTTDDNDILETLKNEKFLISTTFKSFFEIISNFKLDNVLIVIDECHNLIHHPNLQEILTYHQNKLLITATPPNILREEMDIDVIYSLSLREAISKKFICDYELYLPYIDNDIPIELKMLDEDFVKKSLFLISGMLETGSHKCIAYFQSQEECLLFNKIFETVVQEYHSLPVWTNLITCDDNSKKRENIIKNFEKDEDRLDTIKVLSSIRILDEGVDIKKCDSIFISKLTDKTSQIRTVQRIFRANRLDENNPGKKANCFIWSEDVNKIINGLCFLKENDNNFFESKIKTISTNYDKKTRNKKEKDLFENEIKKTIQIKCLTFQELWLKRLKDLKEFIDKHKEKPKKETNEILLNWMNLQNGFYKNNIFIKDYKNIEWKNFLEEYAEFFISNEENWLMNFNEFKKKYKEEKINQNKWFSTQKQNYKNKIGFYENDKLKTLFEEFMNEFPELFLSKNENWINNFNKVKGYIIEHKQRPPRTSTDKDIAYLGQWLQNQIIAFKKDDKMMKDDEIRKIFDYFLNEYADLFLSKEEYWKNQLNNIEKFILDKKRKPKSTIKEEKGLAVWFSEQQTNYNREEGLMKNEEIKNIFKEFMEKHKIIRYDELWFFRLNQVKDFIKENGRKPKPYKRVGLENTLGAWISTQTKNYKTNKYAMKIPENRKEWEIFCKEYL